MGWRAEQEARDAALQQTLQEIHGAIRDLTPAVVSKPLSEPVGHDLRRVQGLAVAIRLCRDVDAGETLLQSLKEVPREYRSGVYGLTVNCPCGTTVGVPRMLAPCGGCDRWYVGDESGVWAVRLPKEPRAAAA